MKKTKGKRRTVTLTAAQIQQLRRDQALIAKELPKLAAKHERICEAAAERTTSGALRRAIHSSKFLLHDLAHRAGTDMETLDAFLTGERPLTSDIIDRLTKTLKLKLEPADGKPMAGTARPA
ncbi:MAG TPA: hypothetical protein VKE98_21490 [Gemmataceae bacterium]|nr:hypothetical protein [Gemmataceae bacterium]